MTVAMTNQVIHCFVKTVDNSRHLFLSIVYAKNYYIHRRALWNDLCMHRGFVGNHPWVMMGDFNVSLELDDSTIGGSQVTIAMREFHECVEYLCMSDINHSGLHFTWNQRLNALDGMLKKIDRIMANDHFLNDFINSYAIFQPYTISDHCPAILKIPLNNSSVNRPKSFKFSNFIVYREGFEDVVVKGWRRVLVGHRMFQVVKKLRWLKSPLRKIMWHHGSVHKRVMKLKSDLEEA
ncbi:uncharacterized protein [Rutidosis leptorrhynchoides]|uniref:uncharacterized protein n=1 Tax=Rutidosis leptorrhynchoides TaxID=125765 RepID=UPI003A98D117